MLPRTNTQIALATAVAVSGAWLYAVPDFEPLLALITSVLAYAASLNDRQVISESVAASTTALVGHGPHPNGLLKSASIIDRPKIIQENYRNFPPLGGQEILGVLEVLSIIDRPKAIPLLLSRLSSPLTQSETEAILEKLSIIDREVAAKHLSYARPCSHFEADG